MSNLLKISFEKRNAERKHLPPTESDCLSGKCCRCLDCKHVCIFAKCPPSLTNAEQESSYTCRNYECFLKNHTVCREKNNKS